MNRKGFTLIEMISVVLIIGVLAGIAIPRLWSVRIAAYDRTAQSDVRRAAIAAEGYFADHMEYPKNKNEANFDASPGIKFRWKRNNKDGTLEFRAFHPKSGYVYLATYPPEILITKEPR